MRRSIAAAALSLTLAGSVLSVGTSTAAAADRQRDPDPATVPTTTVPEPTPTQALATATELLTDEPAAAPEAETPDAAVASDTPAVTLALRDLFVALPRLTGSDRARAESLLARPTDRGADPEGDGYNRRAKRSCVTRMCLHWVGRGTDAPPDRRWVGTTLRAMQGVWTTEVGKLGYRAPVRDGRRGGDDRFDVYLKELGSRGVYGYCVPERRKKGFRRLASGYCVLDDDFARAQFGRKPVQTLRVTAAHEFFHAIQFGYDYQEDRWLLENTATWMEERHADSVNDNRQYLRAGQIGTPDQPLDTFAPDGFNQYGNWPFFEYLSQRLGTRAVKRVWTAAGHGPGDGGAHSTEAVRRVLAPKMRFSTFYAQYAMANTTPGRVYTEGKSWPAPRMMSTRTLGRGDSVNGTRAINHLSTKPYRFRPARDLRRRVWRAKVTVDGPARATGPVAGVVRVMKSGQLARTQLDLDADGKGSVRIPFNRRQTTELYVVLANASIRFNCRRGTNYTCQGTSRDDGRSYRLGVEVVRR